MKKNSLKNFLTCIITACASLSMSLAQSPNWGHSLTLTDNFLPNVGWVTPANGCTGSIDVNTTVSGAISFNNLADGWCDERISKTLNTVPAPFEPTLYDSDNYWFLSFDFTPTNYSSNPLAPAHMLMARTATSALNPVANVVAGTLTPTNVDAIGVYIVNTASNNQNDVRLGIFAKDGANCYSSNGNAAPVAGLPAYQPNGLAVPIGSTYRVTLQRRNVYLILSVINVTTGLSLGQNMMVINNIPGSPNFSDNINGLTTLQSGNLLQGSADRKLTCTIDNLVLERMTPHFFSATVNGISSSFECASVNATIPAVFTAILVAGVTYSWTPAASLSPNVGNIANLPINSATGSYNVICNVGFPALSQYIAASSMGFNINGTCRISAQELNNEDLFLITPNPATDRLQVQLPTAIEMGKLTIHDMSGKEVFTKSIDVNQKELELDITTLPAGMYILRAEGTSEPQVQKFIKN